MTNAPQSFQWQGETVYLAEIKQIQAFKRNGDALFECVRYTYVNRAGVGKYMGFEFANTPLDWDAITISNTEAPPSVERVKTFNVRVKSRRELLAKKTIAYQRVIGKHEGFIQWLESIQNEA